jgi:hypothetical protein
MVLVERPLQRVQRRAVRREALDREDRPAVCLDGEHEARARGLTVDLHGARAADAVLAADVRAGEPGDVADEVRQQGPRLDVARIRLAVDVDRDPHVVDASSIARRTSSVVSARR